MKINHINKAGAALRLQRADFNSIARRVLRLAGRPSSGLELSLIFVSENEALRLNAVYRGKRKPADVLSFPAGEGKDLGDIFICPAAAAKQGKTLKHLFVHGLLHLLGYEHETKKEEQRMKALEEKILS